MNQIRLQIVRLWQLLFSENTRMAYGRAATVTGNIIRETAKLVWLFLCVAVVFLAWLWNASFEGGKNARAWWEELDEPKLSNALTQSKVSLLLAAQSGIYWSLASARSQLGLPLPEKTTAIALQPKSTSIDPKTPNKPGSSEAIAEPEAEAEAIAEPVNVSQEPESMS